MTTLIFAVLVDDIAQFAELRAKYGDARNEFLLAIRSQRRLLLEGTLGERGCLMLIEPPGPLPMALPFSRRVRKFSFDTIVAPNVLQAAFPSE